MSGGHEEPAVTKKYWGLEGERTESQVLGTEKGDEELIVRAGIPHSAPACAGVLLWRGVMNRLGWNGKWSLEVG